MTNNTHDVRTLAIVAHVDHGKTTLVDALFQQSGIYRENQQVTERAMDSMDQERERGITILAKCTSVTYNGTRLQLVDTPGHADFGGEVERSLKMVDGILLLVDAAEGPLPQTRFVLRKALEMGLPTLLAINKIDRSDARALEVLDEVYSLFIDLGAGDEQIDFPVLYTNGREGTATDDLEVPGTDLEPLVQAIIKTIPVQTDKDDEPFLFQVNALGYDDYVGRLIVGRVVRGTVRANQMVQVASSNSRANKRITGVSSFHGVQRSPLEEAQTGDIVALSGVSEINIGDTLSCPDNPQVLEAFEVDEPTVSMVFQVNDGPMAGRSGGKFVTSRHLRDRLNKEAYANVSIHVQDGDTPDQFRVLGRGELQLAVLIESLRRELFEFCVRNPEVLTREGEDGTKEEPIERLVIDVPAEFMGPVTELIGSRKGQMLDQKQEGSRVRLEYTIPTRGLFGLRNTMLTSTRGTAIVHSVFEGWIPWSGSIPQRSLGAIIADRPGTTTPYALFNLQPRGTLFENITTQVYEGMVIGEHTRENDLNVNCVREKKLTNHRAAGKDDSNTIAPPKQLSLELSLEWIRDDEMVEVTPEKIRIRKRILQSNQRSVIARDK